MLVKKSNQYIRRKNELHFGHRSRSERLAVKLARRSSLRTRLENQIWVWLSHEACFGVREASCPSRAPAVSKEPSIAALKRRQRSWTGSAIPQHSEPTANKFAASLAINTHFRP
jgi:hypothetical protein